MIDGLLLVIAENMPLDMLIEEIQEASLHYNINKDDKSLNKLTMLSVLLLAKTNMNNSGKDAFESMKDLELMRKGMALLKTEKQ